jgi:protein disulfide-isomerase A1
LVFIILSLVACAAFEKDGEVLVLTDGDIDDAIKEHQFILIEFYAPWCGHCKRLEPEYTQAAADLVANGVQVALAKVDATQHPKSAEHYGVQGYPTLKWFVNGESSEYGGGRTSKDIVSWISKKTGPPCTTITTQAEFDAFKEKNDVAVVAFVAQGSHEFSVIEKVAHSADDVAFGVVSSDLAKTVDAAAGFPSVVLYKHFDEGRVAHSGKFDKESIETFVGANSVPLVPTFSSETAPKIFGSGIESHFLYFNDESSSAHAGIIEQLRTVATEFKGKTLFVYVPASEERVMTFFDFNKNDLPKAILVALGEGDMKKYGFDKDITASNIRAHVTAFHAGELKPTLKTEEAPADNSGPVKVIVGTTFNDIVLDTTKDVLVEFYAPWCGHCKALTPVYEELGQAFAHDDSIVIAKVDATANDIDHPAVHVQGFPTILFFPANAKDTPLTYDGERDLESLKAYVQEHATVPSSHGSKQQQKEDL